MVIISNFHRFLVTGKIVDENFGFNGRFVFSYLFLKVFIVLLIVYLRILFFGFNSVHGNVIFDDENVLKLFLNVVVLGPIFEEMIFRYHFNFSKKGIYISAAFACFLLYDEWNLLLSVLFYLLILFFIIDKKVKFNRMIFIYCSSVIFACSHLITYPEIFATQNIIEIIFIVGPHFIGGLLLSYVFFRNGIFAAIALHSLWNFIFYTIFIFKLAVLGEI